VVLGWTYVVARSLALSAAYFGTRVPPEVGTALAARRPAHETAAHAQRRQRPRTLSQVVLHDLAAMDWWARLRTARRILAPAPDYMRWRYEVDTAWQLPGAYWARWCTIAADIERTWARGRQPPHAVRRG
jgi:hypothetical protein